MKKFVIVFLAFLMVSSLTPLSFGDARLGPADVPQGVLREGVLSIKFITTVMNSIQLKLLA